MPRIAFETECGETTCDNCVLMSQNKHGDEQFCQLFEKELRCDEYAHVVNRCDQCLSRYKPTDPYMEQLADGWTPISEFVHNDTQPTYVFLYINTHRELDTSLGNSEILENKVVFRSQYDGRLIYPSHFLTLSEYLKILK